MNYMFIASMVQNETVKNVGEAGGARGGLELEICRTKERKRFLGKNQAGFTLFKIK